MAIFISKMRKYWYDLYPLSFCQENVGFDFMRCNDQTVLKYFAYLLLQENAKLKRTENSKTADLTYSKAKKLIDETTCVLEDIINEMKKLQCVDFSGS